MNVELFMVEWPRISTFAEGSPICPKYDFNKMVLCPDCGKPVTGGFWVQPRSISLTKRNVPDFLYTTADSCPFLLSETALEMIEGVGLSGITRTQMIENVRFQRKSKKESMIPKYYHIELARSRITVNHDQSSIVYGRVPGNGACMLCSQRNYTYDFFRKLVLNTDCYEGYDIFQTYEMGDVVFLSSRFVNFYLNSGLTNLHFSPSETYMQWSASYFLDGDENA